MSLKKTPPPFRNRLLGALKVADLALLQSDLEPVSLPRHKRLESANKKIESVYFLEGGMASVVGGLATKPNRDVEVGIIGCEGIAGLPIQIARDGFRLPASTLRNALDKSPSLHRVLLKYAQAFMIQTTHTAIANARGTLEERLARWILMAQDRWDRSEIPLTHEFLSIMLAVRRAGVTEALHKLSDIGLIEHGRGVVTIIDRNGLIKYSNGLYGIPESEYNRLLGKDARA